MEIVVNAILFLSILTIYFLKYKISISLMPEIPIQLAIPWMVLIVLTLLIILQIFNVFFLKTSINKRKKTNWTVKVARFVTPLIFLSVIKYAVTIPIALTKSKTDLVSEVEILNFFDQSEFVEDENIMTDHIMIEKNFLGKVGEVSKEFYDSSNHNIYFNCSYQYSNKCFIKNKFERFDDKKYIREKKLELVEKTYKYELYKTENNLLFLIVIEENNTTFYATYEQNDLNNIYYSMNDFLNDSLSIYNEWVEF